MVWLLCVLYVVRYRSLRRADHSSTGIVPSVVYRVWSWSLDNERALVREGLLAVEIKTRQDTRLVFVTDWVGPFWLGWLQFCLASAIVLAWIDLAYLHVSASLGSLTVVLYSSVLCSLQRSISSLFHYTFFFVLKLLTMIKHSNSQRKFSFPWNYALRHRLHKALLLLPVMSQCSLAYSTTWFSKILLYFYLTHKQRVRPWQNSNALRPEVNTATATCFLAGAKRRSILPEYA